MAGFDNDTMYADNVDFTGSVTPGPTVNTDGQLLIGATATPNIRVGFLTAGAGISITNGAGSITISGTGGVTPIFGVIPDTFTGPGTSPVVPNPGTGNITITGAQIAASGLTNVIRTDSLAANTMTIEIQRSTTAAASTPASNGVSHFDNTIFTVGSDGFVSLVGGSVPPAQKFNIDTSTVPGTDPVVPDASGIVTITGAQVATGTVGANVIRTNSTAANAYSIDIQRTTAVAGSDSTKNGVSHFNSAQFTVDSNGFVSTISGGGGGSWTLIESQTATTAATLTFNTNLDNFTELMFTWNGMGFSTGTILEFNASDDNGSTNISGINNQSLAATFYTASLALGATVSGFMTIQNTPGTIPRISQGWGMPAAGGSVSALPFNIIGTSAKINWIKFFPDSGVFTATINVFGR